MTCSTCGTTLPNHARFCMACGAPQPVTLTCASCRSELPSEARFCLVCGTPVAGVGDASGAVATTTATRPTAPEPLKEAVVGPQGTHQTLAAALAAVAPAARIRLSRGRHEIPGDLIHDRTVTIVGEGMDASEIAVTAGHWGLSFRGSKHTRLRDLTIRYTGTIDPELEEQAETEDDEEFDTTIALVEVDSGEVTLERCRFVGLQVGDEDGTAGLKLGGDVTGVVRACESTGNKFGILLADDAAPELRENLCTANHIGIAYGHRSSGTARRNDVRANVIGIDVYDDAAPALSENTIEDCQGSGLRFYGQTAADVWDNMVKNCGQGIGVYDNSRPLLRQNRIDACFAGLVYLGDAGGQATENTVRGGHRGVSVSGRARPELLRNVVEGGATGFSYSDMAGGTARGNRCSGVREGFSLSDQSCPVIEDSVFRDIEWEEIAIYGDARPTLRNNNTKAERAAQYAQALEQAVAIARQGIEQAVRQGAIPGTLTYDVRLDWLKEKLLNHDTQIALWGVEQGWQSLEVDCLTLVTAIAKDNLATGLIACEMARAGFTLAHRPGTAFEVTAADLLRSAKAQPS